MYLKLSFGEIDMLANICPYCRTGEVHNLPVLTIFYPVAGKRTGTISHAVVSPPPMSSHHRILEPYGRWHATIYMKEQ